MRQIGTAAVLLALFLAGCTSPGVTRDELAAPPVPAPGGVDAIDAQAVNQSLPGVGGGTVLNGAPVVRSLTTDRASGPNDGTFAATLTGEVFDPNTELQLGSLQIALTGPSAIGGSRALMPADVLLTAEPALGADGFAVWGGVPNDGLLHVRYRIAFPAFTTAGTYLATLTATDRAGISHTSAAVEIVITKFALVSVAPAPVDAAGLPLAGARWGGWTATPGAQNVASTNYLKLVNDGDLATPSLVVSFSDAFVGAEDASFSIPIANNIQYAWFEDTTPATSAPSEGSFTFEPGAGATLAFTGKGNVIYVAYRIVKLPDVLPIQAYGSSFTVTEL